MEVRPTHRPRTSHQLHQLFRIKKVRELFRHFVIIVIHARTQTRTDGLTGGYLPAYDNSTCNKSQVTNTLDS